MTPQQEIRLAEAIHHVEMGFAVMSVWSTTPDGTCKCGKPHADKKSIGKHPIPPNGFLSATRDITKVTTMLSAASEPNYGIVWPEDSDSIVFEWDVDGDDWKRRIEALKAEFGPLPPTKTTRSPSGGLHVFYRWPEGVPVPEGNKFHGFVVRWPWKGYVVGPKSRINGTEYQNVGADIIETLPLAWAVTGPVPGTDEPLIRIVGDSEGYELPDKVETGGRHDAIAQYVASRWNRGISEAEILDSVRGTLAKRFVDPMDDARLVEEVQHAFETASKRWKEPAGDLGGSTTIPGPDGDIEIDPLAIESRIERPEPLDASAVPIPVGLAMLLDHYKPFTDAAWSSLMLGSCITMSALVGPVPRLRWRASHRASLFGVLVGDSNWGRKTQVLNEVENAFMQVDPLLDEITKSGIASPEALVDILSAAKGNTLGTILIREHEITNLMTVAAREGNALSGYLRMAWDGARIETNSRTKGAVVASGYNAAFLGGVVPKSLRKYLTADEVANGWANRFLWFHAEPRPGGFDPTASTDLDTGTATYLRDCIERARNLGGSMLVRPAFTMVLSDEALVRMEATALRLDVPPLGAIGVLRQRMPGHIVRLAMVAALFDQSRVVEVEHIQFGEAMVRYAVDSMRSVFGIRVDDAVAMLILSVLAQTPDGWLNTTDLKKVTGKEYSRVQTALRVLLDENLNRPRRPFVGG